MIYGLKATQMMEITAVILSLIGSFLYYLLEVFYIKKQF